MKAPVLGVLRCDVVNRSFEVALLVGTLLALINQGNRIAASGRTPEILLKITLAYLLPCCVSTRAIIAAVLHAEREAGR